MIYKHFLILNDSDDSLDLDKAAHFYNYELNTAIHIFRKENRSSNGVLLVYTGQSWRFLGYLKDLVA